MSVAWLVLGVVFGYLWFKLERDSPYEDTMIGTVFSSAFTAYVEEVDRYLEAEPNKRSWMENPAKPEVWKKRVNSEGARLRKSLGGAAFALFICLLLNTIGRSLMPPLDSPARADAREGLAMMSTVIPLFWLWAQARSNGLVQGFIDGYIAGRGRS